MEANASDAMALASYMELMMCSVLQSVKSPRGVTDANVTLLQSPVSSAVILQTTTPTCDRYFVTNKRLVVS